MQCYACSVFNATYRLRIEGYFEMFGAQERIRTSTPLPALDPESSASASSATWAQGAVMKGENIVLAAPGFVKPASIAPQCVMKPCSLSGTIKTHSCFFMVCRVYTPAIRRRAHATATLQFDKLAF